MLPMETCKSNRVSRYWFEWLLWPLCLHKNHPWKSGFKKKWSKMLEVKPFFLCMHWIHPLCDHIGLLCLSGLIVYCMCAYLLICRRPIQLLCIFHSNAPFRPQLAASRVGQPAGIRKRGSWKDGSHSAEHSDRTGCWRWGNKSLT